MDNAPITTPGPGEVRLWRVETHGMVVERLPRDPLALRISLGSPYALPEASYCVFRGDPQQVVELLERALAIFRPMVEEGRVP